MTSFNPASFTTFNPVAAARRERAEAPTAAGTHAMVRELEQAAARFALRRDGFAQGKEATCLDLAAKLERFGSFVSEKQREFAVKLIEWSKPRPVQPRMTLQSDEQRADDAYAKPAASATVVSLPKLFDLMQRLSKLTIGKLTIVRKNQDSLCWVKHEGAEKVVGRIADGVLTLWNRPTVDSSEVWAALSKIEADPEAAAALHGKLSGRCSVCSRDLTDPESIERGIGPICLTKF